MKRRVPSKAALAMRLLSRRPPRLAPQQLRDLAMAHIVNLDAIASGQADVEILQQTLGGVFTWQRVAERTGRGVPEMHTQHDLMMDLWARYVRTGAVVFVGNEYELAKTGTQVMDALAELVDHRTALIASEWAERRLRRFIGLPGVPA
jgi:hypothetical protein